MRALLISLRLPDDEMAAHEHLCFLQRSGLKDLEVHSMVHGRPDHGFLRKYDVIFFGGSGAYSVLDDVNWIADGISTLQDVVELRIPSFASCFGFQGLAKALGGTVIRDKENEEMGATWLNITEAGEADPLFGHLPRAGFWAQEGHHDRVSVLPPGVTLLAQGSKVTEQAFKVDGAPFWASQFHPELTVKTTLDRFIHYRDHYIDDGLGDEIFAMLSAGQDSEELDLLLPNLLSWIEQS